MEEEAILQNNLLLLEDPEAAEISSNSFEMEPEPSTKDKPKKKNLVGRYFQDSWKVKFPWVERDPKGSNLVFCPYCTKHLKPKITNIQDHARSKRHILETSTVKQRKSQKESTRKDFRKKLELRNGSELYNQRISSRINPHDNLNNETNLCSQTISVTLSENDGIIEARFEDSKTQAEYTQSDSAHTTLSDNKESLEVLNDDEDESVSSQETEDECEGIPMARCNICSVEFENQKELFFHLKLHYEDQNEDNALNLDNDTTFSKESPSESEMTENAEDEFAILCVRFNWLSKNSLFPNAGYCKMCDEAMRLTKYYLKKHEISFEHMRQVNPSLTLEDYKKIRSTKSDNTRRRTSGFKKVVDEKGRIRLECSECFKLFKRSSIWTHMRIHEDLRPHKCHLCPWAFRQSNDLKSHINAVHQRLTDYQCEICGSSFSRLSSLNLHIKIHSDLRDVVCDVCNKGFRSISKMKEHRRIHTGEKPFSCDVCSMSFRVKSDMIRHRTNVHEKGIKRTKKAKKRRPRKTDLTHNQHLQHHQYYTLSEPPPQHEYMHVLEIDDLTTVHVDPFNPEQIIIYSTSDQTDIS